MLSSSSSSVALLVGFVLVCAVVMCVCMICEFCCLQAKFVGCWYAFLLLLVGLVWNVLRFSFVVVVVVTVGCACEFLRPGVPVRNSTT